MNDFFSQLRAFYDGLEPARRRALWAAVVGAVLLVVGVGVWASQPNYVVLTRASSVDEATAVARSLAMAGIPYDTDTDGLTIRVPATSELDARRAASSEDGIVGLEGLEQIDPWVSPFQEQLHRQRMLQGELVRTINTLRGVSASTVQLNLPERAAFLRDEARSTAAVTVRPELGAQIDRNTARSIAQLVSHAVAGMTMDDVSVVDASSGRVLWSGQKDDAEGGGADGDLAVLAARREAALADGVRASLSRLLGSPEAAAVTVHVELENSAVQSTVNEIDPESASPSRERIESEENGTATTAPIGIPGTDANLPERAAIGGTEAAGGRKRDSSETTYQYSQTQTTTVKPAGDVRRVSASVMIDTAALATVLGKDATPEQEQQLRKEIEGAVKAALGHSAARGDDVVVTFLAFAPTALEEAEVTPTLTVAERYAPTGLAVLALVLAFLFVVRPLIRAVRPAPVEAAVTAAAADELAEVGGSMVPPIPGSAEDDEMDLATRLRLYAEGYQSLQPQHVSDLVRRESEHSAEVLRRWIRTHGGAS